MGTGRDRMIPVYVESPYGGDVSANLAYLGECLRDCIKRGEVPFASHAIYPLALDDNDPEQREQGLALGEYWRHHCQRTVVYIDRGVSEGMLRGIEAAERMGMRVEYRAVGAADGQRATDPAGDQAEVRSASGGGVIQKQHRLR